MVCQHHMFVDLYGGADCLSGQGPDVVGLRCE